MYNAIITRLKNVRTFPDADRLKLATCVGNQVVIGLNYEEGELGIYFQSDGILTPEFCKENNLYRDSSLNKDKDAKPGMFDANGRVRAQTFRKQKSDGFWCPLELVKFTGVKESDLVEGFEFDTLNGVLICKKYVNNETAKAAKGNQPKKDKKSKSSVQFVEHIDTKHMLRKVEDINPDDLIITSVKCHGTSGRVGHVLIERELTFIEKITKFFGANINNKQWVYLNGTRRVVIEESSGSQYHDPSIRDKAFNLFKGNLKKGECVFFEIVGYKSLGRPIMGRVDTTKLNDKKFTKQYSNAGDGTNMIFKYGCSDGECDIYVYRITLSNEDGYSVDYSWDDVKKRCGELGVKHVPEIDRFTVNEFKLRNNITTDEEFKDKYTEYIDKISDGPDRIDPTHWSEGVCVRLESGLTVRIYKNKNFIFKCLEGIVKDSGVIDEEESQSECETN